MFYVGFRCLYWCTYGSLRATCWSLPFIFQECSSPGCVRFEQGFPVCRLLLRRCSWSPLLSHLGWSFGDLAVGSFRGQGSLFKGLFSEAEKIIKGRRYAGFSRHHKIMSMCLLGAGSLANMLKKHVLGRRARMLYLYEVPGYLASFKKRSLT